jgi:hypothetical protein
MVSRQPGTCLAAFSAAEAVADAILYEGYLLYPYRRSSVKNQVRWQFGVVAPRGWAQVHAPSYAGVAGSAESWWQQTECLVEAGQDAAVAVKVRFLQLQSRSVHEQLPGGALREVSELRAGQRLELSFDEAVPREFEFSAMLGELAAGGRRLTLNIPGGQDSEPVRGEHGSPAGAVVRSRWPVTAEVTVTAARLAAPAPLYRLRLRIENAAGTAGPRSTRDEALRYSLIAAHSLVAVDGGAFLSLLDPPSWALHAAQECSNVHTFPVLAGAPGERSLILSAPIILPDHPRVAPESPGDLHDATEIDEILTLRTLALTDAEKSEARATDPRAAAIVDRVDSMPAEVMARLHGAVRSLRPGPAARHDSADAAGHSAAGRGDAHMHDPGSAMRPDVPWWDPGADSSVSPSTDSITVAGQRLARGSRVRLRPRLRGADPQDMFLAGRPARVEAVLTDVDGSRQLAVTLDDDPAAELNVWYGRYRYFAPDEVEPLQPARDAG